MIANLLLVAIGGAVGAALRFLSVRAAAALTGETAWGTLFVNVVGSFVMGVLAIYVVHRFGETGGRATAFAMTGCLGAFTTFSAFSLDAFRLFEDGHLGAAGLYVAASVLLSIGALVVGIALARTMLP